MKELLRLFRVKHWLKNVLVFVVPILNYNLLSLSIVGDLLVAFIAISLGASSVYIFNDIKDLEDDRKHPVKRLRPLASGVISIKSAVAALSVLFVGSLMLSYSVNWSTFCLVVIYLATNAAYTLYLKSQRFIDIFCLAIFLLIRLLIGVYVSGFPVTNQFVLFVLLVLLSLSLKKRYRELVIRQAESNQRIRGYFGRDRNLLSSLSKITIFAAIGFYNIHVMGLSGFGGHRFVLVSLASLYMAFILSEDDGPEDVVDLISERKTIIPLLVNVILLLVFI